MRKKGEEDKLYTLTSTLLDTTPHESEEEGEEEL